MSTLLTLARSDVETGLRRIEDALSKVESHRLADRRQVAAARGACSLLRYLVAGMVSGERTSADESETLVVRS